MYVSDYSDKNRILGSTAKMMIVTHDNDDENRPEKTLVDCEKDCQGNGGEQGEREVQWAG